MAKKKKEKIANISKRPSTALDISSKQKKLFPEIETPISLWYKDSFFLSSMAIILIIMLSLSLKSGINGDDYFQNTYSDQLINWYATLGKDTSCFSHPRGPIQLYGGLYEILTGATNRILGYDSLDINYHNVRHIWNALFGAVAILFVGLLSRLAMGRIAGLISIWLMFLSPNFLGHSLMNPKDIPFAAGYSMALFYIYLLLREFPKPRISTLIGISIGIGIAFGVRVGGLMLVGYLFLFGLAEITYYYKDHGLFSYENMKKIMYQFILPSIVGIIMGLIFWPYAFVDPLEHVYEAFTGMSNFYVNIRMLFQGEMIFSKDIPFYYTTIWMFMTIPAICYVGIFLFFIFFQKLLKTVPTASTFIIFSFLFPLLFVVLKKSPMYDGWRHMIFIYGSLVILISFGLTQFIYTFKPFNKIYYYSAISIVIILGVEPAIFILKNYSYPYVYFNPLTGGLKNSLGKFETDYWGVSTRKAVDWLEKQNILNENMQDTITISSDFNYSLERYLNKKYKGKVKVRYVKYRQRYDQKWDYGIFTSRFLDGAHLRNGTWPPKSIIHSVEAGGVPICIIMKDEGHVAYEAQKALKSQNYEEAIRLLEQSIQQDEYNELSLIGLADATMAVGDFVKAENAIKAHDKVVPESYITQNLSGLLSIRQNKIDQAITAFKNAVRLQEDNGTGYYYLAYIYFNQKNNQEAISNIKKAVEVSPKFKAAYDLAAQIFEQAGDPGMAKAYRDAAQKI